MRFGKTIPLCSTRSRGSFFHPQRQNSPLAFSAAGFEFISVFDPCAQGQETMGYGYREGKSDTPCQSVACLRASLDLTTPVLTQWAPSTQIRLRLHCRCPSVTIYGTFHKVSIKHLGRYCDEFSYRFNRRGQQLQMFGETMKHLTRGKALPYAKLTASRVSEP